ncbi:ABC transporter permease [Spirosoma sp. SC4-14]|uniref:ABC transporter permease n=1 Tax=Spirosoma sp. SC4-14 TaxID=3128900 RepID=UPI0030CDDF46
MRQIRFLIEKEFKQLFRNTILLRMMIGTPVLQLILLSYAANYEVKNLNISILDQDHTTFSQRLAGKFRHIDNFRFLGYVPSLKQAQNDLLVGRADLVLVIPPRFERDLYREDQAPVQLLVNAVDGSKAGIANGYASSIVQDFNQEVRIENVPVAPGLSQQLAIEPQYWYNPRLEYRTFMVPGVLFELLILIGMLIAALNIVREKEIGTQEQLNVTPIKKYQFILGKLIPFVLIGLLQLTMGLLVAVFLFNIPIEGSLALLYGFAFLFLLLCVGMGLLISAVSETQQQAMYAAFFFIMFFILLSGLFSSIEDMPRWAQIINIINPLQYIIAVGRNVMLKGSGFRDMQSQFVALLILTVVVLSLATWRYRKTV